MKKSNDDNMSYYRPVLRLTDLSKVYEQVIQNQFFSYLEYNWLLDKEQRGFRRGKSTITVVTDFIQSILESIDSKVFLDASRAFDIFHIITFLKTFRN